MEPTKQETIYATKNQIADELEPQEIKDLRQKIKNKEEELDELDYWECDDSEFDDYLDECYGSIKIAGLTYDTSHALKEIDECAYEDEKDSYESTRRDELKDECREEIEDLQDDLNDLLENGIS